MVLLFQLKQEVPPMSLLEHVDAATNLAKNNELQLLVFKVSDEKEAPYYAINVFKTREVIESSRHHLTLMPATHPLLEGTIILRNMQMPLLNLPLWLNVQLTEDKIKKSNILVCDFNGIIIGLRIMLAHRVIKKNWSQMHAPDSYRVGNDGIVINDTRLEDGSLCLILDYEKLLSEVIPQAMVDTESSPGNLENISIPHKLKNGTVLIAEDSKTAQNHLRRIFENSGIKYKMFDNGKLLVSYIASLQIPEDIPAIITDIEMPEMSGFTVIQHLKSQPSTKNIPIIVNSSMTGDNNKREAETLGADGFVDKTKSLDIIPLIADIISKN